MKKMLLVFIFALLCFSCDRSAKNEALKIIFHPIGYPQKTLVIYDNEDAKFTNCLIEKLRKAHVAYFYEPPKHRCEEKIYIESNDKVYEYEASERNIVYDVQRKKHLKCDALAYIYSIFAERYLDTLFKEFELESQAGDWKSL